MRNDDGIANAWVVRQVQRQWRWRPTGACAAFKNVAYAMDMHRATLDCLADGGVQLSATIVVKESTEEPDGAHQRAVLAGNVGQELLAQRCRPNESVCGTELPGAP